MLNEGVAPLSHTPKLHDRTEIWKDITGKAIKIYLGDLKEWEFISHIFQEFLPETVIHYAEQPSAPYSMLRRESASLTITNNISVTANVIFASHEYCPDVHIIKLGTMGEYGTPNIDIEEGWIDVKHKNREEKFLYPRQAGSLYHTTKIMDTDLLWYYVRVWGLRVTDLMQGPVYGIFTDESLLDSRLLTLFSYDEIFGTVLNRFIVQAVAGYPLTVYGKGGQTRGYLNIKDTLQCVSLAIENPPKEGELNIYNQFTETFSVNELALKVKNEASKFGLEISIKNINNPRKEMEEHYYNPAHTGLLELGLKPNYLTDSVLNKMIEHVLKYKDSIDKKMIFRGVKWA